MSNAEANPKSLVPESFSRGAEDLDRNLHAAVARRTGGLSPIGLGQVWWDWAAHLAAAPGRRAELALSAWINAARLISGPEVGGFSTEAAADKRFRDESWRNWPWSTMAASHKAAEDWWMEATTGLRGVSKHHERVVSFVARQMLDTLSPSNGFWTNPEVLRRTMDEKGQNLTRGAQHMWEDATQLATGQKPESLAAFEVGKAVAVTPGKVVFRNHLIELIQYAPVTETVNLEPILIVPAWIMKYYILDLSPHNSLIRWLVGQGHTVFCISWRNPNREDRNLGMDDYLNQGVMAALDVVGKIVPDQRIHATGYCLGGTLLATAAAAMGRDGDMRLASLTLLAAQTDFTEAGELTLFIGSSQLALLEDMMWKQGVLGADQMAGTFQLLKSNDLIWSRMQREYLLGQRGEPSDLMAWNADSTRLPYRMHSEYLRKFFLDNDLAEGRFEVGDAPVALSDIRMPIFAVGTENDHVAPWKSAFKIQRLVEADVTFVLASGGHNGGIISEPGHPTRYYRLLTTGDDAPFLAPEDWVEAADLNDGSWWIAWGDWLASRSGAPVPPPRMGAPRNRLKPMCDAPGTYVFQE